MESEHMKKLDSGSGLIGTNRISLEQLKQEVCGVNIANPLEYNTEILTKLSMDGVYTDDPEVHSKFTDINIQKFEERLLKNGQKQYFKKNGELKLDNDLLDDEITRPIDLAFDKTVAT